MLMEHGEACSIRLAQAGELPVSVQDAADGLACLLTDTREFQEYLRRGRAVRIDAEASRLRALLIDPEGEALDLAAVQTSLEALPVSQAYAASRKAVREMVGAVERIIAQAAGLPFAENAIVDGAT